MGQTMTTIALAVPASCSRLPFISLLPPPRFDNLFSRNVLGHSAEARLGFDEE